MRFLANENFPLTSVVALREQGHDVVAVSQESPGSTDSAVLERAAREERIILTFDRDYGDLIYRWGSSGLPGVVYFRFVPLSPDEPCEILLQLLSTGNISLLGRFTVAERGSVRQRPLP